MNIPDGQHLALNKAVLQEPSPEEGRLVLWLRGASNGHYHLWERVSTLPRAEVTINQGVCAAAATSVRVRQRRRGLLGRLLACFTGTTPERGWLLPNGEAAEQCGDRQADLWLAWSEDEACHLEEARVKARWPDSTRLQQLGPHLFLVATPRPAAVTQEVTSAPTEDPPLVFAERLLAAARQAGNLHAEVSALADVGILSLRQGDFRRGAAALQEALALARRVRHRTAEIDALGNLGLAALALKELDRGLELCRQALALARAMVDPLAEKTALERLGMPYSVMGGPSEALACYEQALALARTAGDRQHEADLLWHMAVQHAELGRRDQAAAVAQASVDLLRGLGSPQAVHLEAELQKYRLTAPGALPGGAGEGRMPGSLFGGPIVVSAAASQHSAGQGVSPPCLLRMAFSAAKSAARFLGAGMKVVSPEVHHERQRVCAGCPHYTGLRCRVCGCFTNAKAWLPHEHCPLGKWGS